MQHANLAAQKRRVVRCHNQLLRSPELCWLGPVVLTGAVDYVDTPTHRVTTAATDGYNVWYNVGFTATLAEAELMALIVHENLHKAYRQLALWDALRTTIKAEPNAETRVRYLDMAMDYVINADIMDMASRNPTSIRLPQGGLYDPIFDGMSTRDVFEYLDKNGPPQSSNPMDTHEPANNASEPQRQQQKADIEQALREGQLLQRSKGVTGSASGNRLLATLKPPKLPWQTLLQRFVNDRMWGSDLPSYSKLHRRTALVNYPVPTRYDDTIGDIVIAVDTSGSIGDADLRLMLSDVVGLTKTMLPETTHVLYWGSAVVRHEVYDRTNVDDIPRATKPADGGGTAVRCVYEWVMGQRTKPAVVVLFTDGYIDDWPTTWPCPVFGVITTDTAVPITHTTLR